MVFLYNAYRPVPLPVLNNMGRKLMSGKDLFVLIKLIFATLVGFSSSVAFSAGYERERLTELGYDMTACPSTPASDYTTKTSVRLTFVNDTGFVIQPSWIDLEGRIRFRKVIGINDAFDEATYAGTNWLFFDYRNKRCLSLWSAGVDHRDIDLKISSVGIKASSGHLFICEWGDCSQGMGKEVWASGVSYVGNHQDNQRYGYGIFFDSDGDVCESYFRNGFANGPSSCLYKNGDRFFGYLKDGKRYGYGFYVDESGKIIKEGLYENDALVTRTKKPSDALFIEINQLRALVNAGLIAAYLPTELQALPEIERRPTQPESPIKIKAQVRESETPIDEVFGGPVVVQPNSKPTPSRINLNDRLQLAAAELHAARRSNVMWSVDEIKMNFEEMKLELLQTINTDQLDSSEQSLRDASVTAYCSAKAMKIFIENNIPALWIYRIGDTGTYEVLVTPASCKAP